MPLTVKLSLPLQSPRSANDKTSENSRHIRSWRKRLKQDPVKWTEYKSLEATRAKQYRNHLTDEQKQHARQKNLERQRRFLSKRKLQDHEVNTEDDKIPVPPKQRKMLTRNERLNKQNYDCQKKRESREKMNSQQKRRVREKDAMRRREKRDAQKTEQSSKRTPVRAEVPPNTKQATATLSGFSSHSAKRMAISRMWSKIPKEPEKFADIIVGFIKGKCNTPRKRAALKARGVTTCRKEINFLDPIVQQARSTIAILKKKRDTSSLKHRRLLVSSLMVAKKYRIQSQLARTLDLRPHYIANISNSANDAQSDRRPIRADATCMDVVINIHTFFKNPKVSRELPCMRTVIKKQQQQKFVMEVSMQQAYNMWKMENPDNNVVSLSVFTKLRPSCILLQHKIRLNQCLCEYCTDIMLKLQSLNRTLQACNCKDIKVKDKYELISLSMCEKGDNKYHQPKCVARTCPECGISLLKKKFEKFVEDNEDKVVTWLKWESQSYMHDGKQKSKKVQATKRGSCSSLVGELLTETESLAKHLFTANWQQDQFALIQTKLPRDWCIFVLDFAENYACCSQDEIQSAHWAIQQVTVHPLVCYYNCNHGESTHLVQEALVFLSDDLIHDAHAVHHFETLALRHLKEKRELNVRHVVEFTDGCGGQYKSRTPFADISFAKVTHGISFERNFFGSRHGKGPSDGVSGVVKSAVRRAVISRRVVVNTAEDMFTYCESTLTKDSCDKQRRSFYFIKRGDIQRSRIESEVKTALPGTRALHSVKCVSPGILDTRLITCFCDGCLFNSEPQSQCSNLTYVQPWQRRTLKMAHSIPVDSRPVTDSPNSPTDEINEDRHVATGSEDIDDLWKLLTTKAPPVNGEESENESDNADFDLDTVMLELLKVPPTGGAQATGMPGPPDDGAQATGMPGPPDDGAQATGMLGPPDDGARATGMLGPPDDGALATGMPGPPDDGAQATGMPGPPDDGAQATGMPGPPDDGARAMGMPGPPDDGAQATGIPGPDDVQVTAVPEYAGQMTMKPVPPSYGALVLGDEYDHSMTDKLQGSLSITVVEVKLNRYIYNGFRRQDRSPCRSNQCNTVINVCVFEQPPFGDNGNCALGSQITSPLGFGDINMEAVTSLGSGVSNPLEFETDRLRPWGVNISVYDSMLDGQLVLINSFINSGDEVMLTRFDSRPRYFSPEAKPLYVETNPSLDYELRAYCAVNYHGGDCTIFCDPINRERFACNNFGERICNNNFIGFPNCFTPNPCAKAPCLNSGACDARGEDDFKCSCQQGYTGDFCQEAVDDCLSNPCRNGGTCFDQINAYTCECRDGWAGDTCEEDINECATLPCKNNGICVEGVPGDYSCRCLPGFTGVNCEVDINECIPNPCQNNGACAQDRPASFACTCALGFDGSRCERNIDDCATAPCRNGGICIDGIARYTCQCSTGFIGQNCETDVDECQSRPCLNGGQCRQTPGGGFTCICRSGFDGIRCETDVDECANNPCANGFCINTRGSFSCSCNVGFTGSLCEIDVDECATNPCVQGTCAQQGIGDYRCTCFNGYSGKNCDENVNECLSNPCRQGTCRENVVGSYVCDCFTGWEGRDCDRDIDECSANPCANGRCQQTTPGNYRCMCDAGWVGANCDSNINECASSPCQNGACSEPVSGSYTCTCNDGWSGTNCEILLNLCDAEPCQNGGSCLMIGPGLYQCTCPPNYIGPNCQIKLRVCLPNPCNNGGECTDDQNGHAICQCPNGWIGEACEREVANNFPISASDFTCPEAYGLFPAPGICVRFYHCSHNVPHSKACPGNLHFNPFLKVCDWPKNAQCEFNNMK